MASAYAQGEELLLQEYFSACKDGTWLDVREVLNRMPFYLGTLCDANTMMNALHFICLGNNLNVAETLHQLRNEMFVHYLYSKSNSNETPIDLACRIGHVKMAELLFRAAIDVGAHPDCSEGTVLHIACAHGHVDIVRMLLGIDNSLINACKAWTNDTPLHKAVQSGNIEVVRVLLNNGADVNCQTNTSRSPLHIAVCVKKGDILKLLLQHPNINIEAADWMGKTALDMASAMPNWQAVDLLLAYGANASTRDGRGTAPLHSAARLGASRIFKCLLEAGAEVNVVNKSDETPLSVASAGGHADMVSALLDRGAEMYVAGRCEALRSARGLKRWHIVRMLTATLIDRYTARGLGEMLLSQGMAWMVKRVSRH